MIIDSIKDLNKQLNIERVKGKSIALVPTMGGLHDGHISLIKKAQEIADITILTIFVNPKQFNQQSDYNNYQRNLKQDLKKVGQYNISYIFTPTIEEIYPKNFTTNITISSYNDCLCAKYRPGHFEGVAIIIAKLFNITRPNYAIFGEKDFQQLKIIEKLTQDLDYQIKIIGCPAVRGKDGLVLSSRNANLSKNALKLATNIYKSLSRVRDIAVNESKMIDELISKEKESLMASGIKVEYYEARYENDLNLALDQHKTPVRIFISVFVENVRLIDNLALYDLSSSKKL